VPLLAGQRRAPYRSHCAATHRPMDRPSALRAKCRRMAASPVVPASFLCAPCLCEERKQFRLDELHQSSDADVSGSLLTRGDTSRQPSIEGTRAPAAKPSTPTLESIWERAQACIL
jgi:hypothetical protein